MFILFFNSILKVSFSLLLPKDSLKTKCNNSSVNVKNELRNLHNKCFHSNQLKMSSISITLGKDQSIEKDKVGVDNNKTWDSTIINVFDDNEEEVEESSIISGFEMSDAQMAELISVKKSSQYNV